MKERLQKILSARGLASRRAAEELILAGRVRVNGAPATLGQSADPDTDAIEVDGRPLPPAAAAVCLALHKPAGYVTTLSDEQGRPDVSALVRDAPARVYPVGRLDLNSSGLLLMTNDGALAYRLTHPSHEVVKRYHALVRGDVPAALPTLRAPALLDGYRTRPAEVRVLRPEPEGALLEFSIHEGRNRQIRRLCELANVRVLRLCRVAVGEIRLGDLAPGRWRPLTEAETQYLRSL